MRTPSHSKQDFIKEARRQSLAVAESPQAKEDQEFIDAVSDWTWASDSPRLQEKRPGPWLVPACSWLPG
jgi:hypothetical protein